ncbi:MAG: response regulator transcription factor [Bacteroidetes bacterium]|nr:response regulator transcription factor [Bacteroidota bacterium]
MQQKSNVLVVDDHKLICDSIAALIEKTNLVSKVFSAYSGEVAIDKIKSNSVQIALVDARMPGISGVVLMQALRKNYPALKIVAMTSFHETATLKELLSIKPNGILLKQTTGADDIRVCVQTILGGETFYSEDILIDLRKIDLLQFSSVAFSKREKEIMQLLSKGKVTKEIAEELKLSPATVEDYRKELLRKTETRNSPELIAYMHRNGLL